MRQVGSMLFSIVLLSMLSIDLVIDILKIYIAYL